MSNAMQDAINAALGLSKVKPGVAAAVATATPEKVKTNLSGYLLDQLIAMRAEATKAQAEAIDLAVVARYRNRIAAGKAIFPKMVAYIATHCPDAIDAEAKLWQKPEAKPKAAAKAKPAFDAKAALAALGVPPEKAEAAMAFLSIIASGDTDVTVAKTPAKRTRKPRKAA